MESAAPDNRVLVIDDDAKLLSLLSEYLSRFRMEVLTASGPREGIRLLESADPDLVVLDLLLPGMDGFEVCKEIRRRGDTPILMLSARGEAMDRIVGLELGADDYMAKPFEPRELVTRIKAILRRSGPSEREDTIRFGALEIRAAARDAFLDGKPLGLTSMEYELLRLLAVNPGKKLGRDELTRSLQGIEGSGFSRSIDILVSRLRAKLGETARTARYIKSVHGFGYIFVGKPE
jgi:DNA-binding response OmpR family regulator